MTLMRFLIIVVGLIYACIAAGYAYHGKWSNAGVWICYSLANYFLYQMDGKE